MADLEMREPIPLDRQRGEKSRADLQCVWCVVKGVFEQFHGFTPLLKLLAQLELIEFVGGDELFNRLLVKSSLLRRSEHKVSSIVPQ